MDGRPARVPVSAAAARPSHREAEELPVKVAVLDIEEVPASIPAARPGGGRYRGLWLLVRRGGIPQRLLRLRFVGEAITRDEIERHLRELGLTSAGAGVRPPPPDPPPRISVVVCSLFARSDELHDALGSIAALDYPDLELLVVDNRREIHGDAGWVAELPRTRVLHEPRPGLSAARNRGLAAATGALVAFTDDDVVVERDWLAALARRFARRPDEACVTGLVLPRDLDTPAQLRFETYYEGFGPQALDAVSRRLDHGPPRGLLRRATMRETDDDGRVRSTFSLYSLGRFGVGANMAFRAGPLREAGGFDLALGAGTPALGGEDLDIFARLAWRGHGIGFEPSAIVFHRHREDDAALRRQIKAYGLGFTATLLALVADDPRHLGALAATAPHAARQLGASFLHKRRSGAQRASAAPESSSAALARLELRGMFEGPPAYLRSRRAARRLDADTV